MSKPLVVGCDTSYAFILIEKDELAKVNPYEYNLRNSFGKLSSDHFSSELRGLFRLNPQMPTRRQVMKPKMKTNLHT